MSPTEPDRIDALSEAIGANDDGSRQFETLNQGIDAGLDAVVSMLSNRELLNQARDLLLDGSGQDLQGLLLDMAQLQVKTVAELSQLSARHTATLAKALRSRRKPRAPQREELLLLDGPVGAEVSGEVVLENRCGRPLSLSLPGHLMFHAEDGRLPAPARFQISGAEGRALTLPADTAEHTVTLSMTIDPLRFSAGRYTATLELADPCSTVNMLQLDLVVRDPA